MFCENCGAPMSEGERFCPRCGAMVQAAPATERMTDRPTGAVAETGRHPLFLAAVICFSAELLLEFISLCMSLSSLERLRYYGLSSASTVVILLLAASILIPVVTLVGLWMTYGAGSDKGLKAGLRLTRTGIFIQMIYFISLLALVMVGMFVVLAESGGRDAGQIMTGLLLLLGGVGAADTLLFYKSYTVLTGAILAAGTDKVPAAPSLYLAVFCFVGAVITGMCALILLGVGGNGILLALTMLAAAGANALFGTIVLRCRNAADKA